MRSLWGIANPEQLATLTKLLKDYAKEMGVVNNADARDLLAERIVALFNEGLPPDEIRRRLDSMTWLH